MTDNGDREMVPLNGRSLPHGFSDDVVQRALTYSMLTGSVAQGWRMLRREMEREGAEVIPTYTGIWDWVRASEECYRAVGGGNKREMVAISEDAARSWGERMLESAESDKLAPTQVGINYGIAMQRRTDWERSGQAGNIMALQLNVSTGGKDADNPWSKDKD